MLLWKQQKKSGVKLERWLTSNVVIDSKLRLDRSVHDDVVNLEDFAKADTQWDQVFVVGNIEGPHAARPEVVPTFDGQSCDWLKYYKLCSGRECSPANECCQLKIPISRLPGETE